MRPPLNAGENVSPSQSAPAAEARFNEAPAERGGKQYEIADIPRTGLLLQ